MKLVVSEDAVADLERLQRFLAEKDDRVAQRAVTALASAINSLSLRELVVPFGRSTTS